MRLRPLIYFTPLIIYAGALRSFTGHGWACYLTLVYAWVFIPLAELVIRPDPANLSKTEEELASDNPLYDAILYLIVLLQLPTVFFFLYHMKDPGLTIIDISGRVATMGLLCGTFGINVGHELGHRVKPFERSLAKISLMTSLYMHFYIEHNRGHHKNVATPEDPSSARYGESLFRFWPRTIIKSYQSAWRIAGAEQRKKGRPALNLRNEMLQAHIIQLAFLSLLWFLFGRTSLYFLAAAAIGILLLETVNYIEHYGLTRKPLGPGKYERAMPQHSWNSNHIIGRLMLFELSRHSDHHYLASRKYQLLRHHGEAPQMPTGYPGMMILSFLPPAWFRIMNKRVRSWQATPDEAFHPHQSKEE
jgi:alkane 1-monooxygenase